MSILDFIAVMSFGITCFCAGYTFGKDIISHKIAAPVRQTERLFCVYIKSTATVYQ